MVQDPPKIRTATAPRLFRSIGSRRRLFLLWGSSGREKNPPGRRDDHVLDPHPNPGSTSVVPGRPMFAPWRCGFLGTGGTSNPAGYAISAFHSAKSNQKQPLNDNELIVQGLKNFAAPKRNSAGGTSKRIRSDSTSGRKLMTRC